MLQKVVLHPHHRKKEKKENQSLEQTLKQNFFQSCNARWAPKDCVQKMDRHAKRFVNH